MMGGTNDAKRQLTSVGQPRRPTALTKTTKEKNSSAGLDLATHVGCGLVRADAEKGGVTEQSLRRPFDKADLDNEARLDPLQFQHLFLGHTAAPPPRMN